MRGTFLVYSFSDPAKIIVHPPPLLEYNEGAQENIVCKAKGKPRPEVQWYKDGRLIAKRKGKLEINFNPVVDGDMARYKCLAHNKGGKSEIYTNITVFCKYTRTIQELIDRISFLLECSRSVSATELL